jgi:hypothetical protein
MTNIAELEKVLEELLLEAYNFKNNNNNNNKGRDIPLDNEVLLFPRKKLKMQRIKSGYWEPRAWFIESRMNETSTKLNQPTSITHEGLTSGFRGAIILDDNGRYIKLKGVSKKTILVPRINALGEFKTENYRGMCDIEEALDEQINAFVLKISDFPLSTIEPEFVEAHCSLKIRNLNAFIKQFRNIPSFSSVKRRNFETEGSYLARLMNNVSRIKGYDPLNLDPYSFRYVSGLRINADTRLDEAVWNLTKKELPEEKENTRDEILKYLFFRAGIAKAFLTVKGFSWSSELENTNNHWGNFVISPKKIVEVGMCDFTRMRDKDSFESYQKFLDYTRLELESFKEDIFDKSTYSSTVPLRYRHFPKTLRKDCFNALRTGYNSIFLFYNKFERDIFPVEAPEKVVAPSKMTLTPCEFKAMIQSVIE